MSRTRMPHCTKIIHNIFGTGTSDLDKEMPKMGIPLDQNTTLYTLSFTGDQIVIAQDRYRRHGVKDNFIGEY